MNHDGDRSEPVIPAEPAYEHVVQTEDTDAISAFSATPEERLTSIIEFAQQSARLSAKPVAAIGQHNSFVLLEEKAQGRQALRFNQTDHTGNETWLTIERMHETPPPLCERAIVKPWLEIPQSPDVVPSLRASAPDWEISEAESPRSKPAGTSKQPRPVPTGPLGFENSPAIGRMPISSPATIKPLSSFNARKRYGDKIKPFNFLLTSHVAPFGYPVGADPERFHLIAPYETDPIQWLKTRWIDQYTGKLYSITTAGHYGTRRAARVKTHRDSLRDYEYHPESKCADSNGKPCTKNTVGLLQRRHVRIDYIVPIGKESNNLEGVEAGVIHSEHEVYTEYPDPQRDRWETKIRPALNKITLSVLQKQTGLSRRMLIDARTEGRRPHPQNQELLRAAEAGSALLAAPSSAANREKETVV